MPLQRSKETYYSSKRDTYAAPQFENALVFSHFENRLKHSRILRRRT
jgi:hypothetical protein